MTSFIIWIVWIFSIRSFLADANVEISSADAEAPQFYHLWRSVEITALDNSCFIIITKVSNFWLISPVSDFKAVISRFWLSCFSVPSGFGFWLRFVPEKQLIILEIFSASALLWDWAWNIHESFNGNYNLILIMIIWVLGEFRLTGSVFEYNKITTLL